MLGFAFSLLTLACSDGKDTAGDTNTDTDTDVDCETIPDDVCGVAATDGDTGCPEGFACSGPSAFVCYRGAECNLPICLPPVARIATTSGPVALRDLAIGDPVWTQDAAGRRVVGQVARLGTMPAPSEHTVVRIRLADEREVLGSPGHPTSDGRTLGQLRVGDALDGSLVITAASEPYRHVRTWDLLPTGPTGHYWANDVLIGSTLAPVGSALAMH